MAPGGLGDILAGRPTRRNIVGFRPESRGSKRGNCAVPRQLLVVIARTPLSGGRSNLALSSAGNDEIAASAAESGLLAMTFRLQWKCLAIGGGVVTVDIIGRTF